MSPEGAIRWCLVEVIQHGDEFFIGIWFVRCAPNGIESGLKDKLCVWGGLVPCVVVGGGVVEFVPGDCVAPSWETSLGDV